MPDLGPALRWPSLDDEPAHARRGWRDTLSAAVDLALVGIVTFGVSLLIVTAGGAVATASAAVHHWSVTGDLPRMSELARRFRQAFLAGVPAGLIGLAIVGLLLLNGSMVARGVVPGGAPFLVVTVVVGLLVAGFLGLVVVAVGRSGGTGWLAAVRSAWTVSVARPWVALALGAVGALAGFLAVSLPVTTPLLVGYLFLALHAVTRRLAPDPRLDPFAPLCGDHDLRVMIGAPRRSAHDHGDLVGW